MPTYEYETIEERPRRFEVKQSMKDEALTRDPETGVPVRRVISGGLGAFLGGTQRGSEPMPRPSTGHGCGGSCACGH